jgi:hypothetical protein
MDGSQPQASPNVAGPLEIRQDTRNGIVAHGTLACPACDAPVAPGAGPLTPGAPLGCPYCGRDGAVRDFLSLSAPARPARVVVRVVQRAQRGLR